MNQDLGKAPLSENAGKGQTDALAQEFVTFVVACGALRFGEFQTKAGRLSPYFFNAGLFSDGSKLAKLGEFYARRLQASGLGVDMLFGPAYKGITLAAATAVELARMGQNLPFAYNRKEAKTHGEGGTLVGAPLQGRVVIIDDVISDGASKRESMTLVQAAGAQTAAVLIALDRMERVGDSPLKSIDGALPGRLNPIGGLEAKRQDGERADNPALTSAVEQFRAAFGVPVLSIATLNDLLVYLELSDNPELKTHLPRVLSYRERYGA